MKTKPQSFESLQGNDLIAEKFTVNFHRRHRLFRSHFDCQHPHKPVPPMSSLPNWKVDMFMLHLNNVFIQTVVLPEKLSVNEQTIQFHCTSELKSLINLKRTGDGFQCDSICNNQYSWIISIRWIYL